MITTIHDKALLVRLSISMPGNTRKDRTITDEVTALHKLTGNAGRWLKLLYPEEAFAPIMKLATAAREWSDKHSLPWAENGVRILPTAAHGEYTREMRRFRSDFEALAESHFLGRLCEWEAQARAMHNGTFRAEEYLPASVLRGKFGLRVTVDPVPHSDDFRCSVDDADRAALDARVSDAVAEAQKELWSRLHAPLAHMAETLKATRTIKKGKRAGEVADMTFKDSLVTNLADIAALIPSLNLTGDPQLSAFAADVQAQLSALNPQALRDDQKVRAEAQAKAQAILDRMAGYFTPEAAA